MKAVWFGPGDLGWLEPEDEFEIGWLRSRPEDWGWEKVSNEWADLERVAITYPPAKWLTFVRSD